MGQTEHWHFSVWCVEGPAAAAGIPRALLSRAGSLPPCSTVRLVVLAATLQLKTCKDTEFPGGSGLKTLPPMPETTGEGGSIPGWGRPLEEGIKTHSSVRAWRIPRTEELRRRQYVGLQESQTRLSRWALMVTARVPTVVGGWAVSLRRPVMSGVTG